MTFAAEQATWTPCEAIRNTAILFEFTMPMISFSIASLRYCRLGMNTLAFAPETFSDHFGLILSSSSAV
jgi:hypothetical protein